MKSTTSHITNFGSFAPSCPADEDGYIHYHDSPRYARATEEQLMVWEESPIELVRNAAAVEQACRNVAEWIKAP